MTMKIRNHKFLAVIMAGVLGVTVLGGCSDKQASNGEPKESTKEEQSAEGEYQATFETTDIDGNSYTEKVFADYDLTMVNVFATWCSPCVQELPDLQKLYEEMKSKKVGVVGIVMDTAKDNGDFATEAVEKAKVLRERAKITYPLLIPDTGYLNGRLSEIQGYPTTFFVDKDGNIVGQTYEGSAGLKEWEEVVEKELANLKGE